VRSSQFVKIDIAPHVCWEFKITWSFYEGAEQTRYVIFFTWLWVNCTSSVDKIKWYNSGWVLIHLQKC